VGQIRDYIEECLRYSGDQYNRALQDLVNYLGHFLGFEVTFGRYHGVQGQIGFDGLWKSPTSFFIVVEVKTTDVYAIKTATLIGYVNALISEQQISDWDHALGLYVIGRPDAELRQLENAILNYGSWRMPFLPRRERISFVLSLWTLYYRLQSCLTSMTSAMKIFLRCSDHLGQLLTLL
jgi:hypothetical protein